MKRRYLASMEIYNRNVTSSWNLMYGIILSAISKPSPSLNGGGDGKNGCKEKRLAAINDA